MNKKFLLLGCALAFGCAGLTGCGDKEKEEETSVVVTEETPATDETEAPVEGEATEETEAPAEDAEVVVEDATVETVVEETEAE